MIYGIGKYLILVGCLFVLSSCDLNSINEPTNKNLINKVNAVEDQWTNYKGDHEPNNAMAQSQFIPYDSSSDYKVNYPTYVSYYNGPEFIKTELYQNTPDSIESVEEADGIIVSFNKKNTPGMKLEAVE